MKISILIANYNNGRFFADCYASLVAQTCTDWEAIILDDASTDDSVDLITELTKEDSRFSLYQNEENRGVGYTKGKLIDLARTEICGFLDPDDALLPKAVEKTLKIFKAREEVALTYSRPVKCDEKLQPLPGITLSARQVPNHDRFFFNCPIQINHFVAFRKKVYLQCEKMEDGLKIAEDQDLYLKLYEKGKVFYIDDANYLYRTHAGGISQFAHKGDSYRYWAMAVLSAMRRRGLTSIRGKRIPEDALDPQAVFRLLQYQNSLKYRLKKRLRVFYQKFFA